VSKTRTTRILLVAAVIVTVVVPLVVSAQGPTAADQGGRTFGGLFPIVPCGTSGTQPCTPCGLLDVLENIVQFVTRGVVGPVAALLFIYAGVLYLISAGNRRRILQARRVLTNTVYGVAIILIAWLVVVQLIKIVAPGSAADRWYEFSCPEYLQAASDIPVVAPIRVVAEGAGAIAQLPPSISCDDYATIANIYKGQQSPTLESPELLALIGCLERDPVVNALSDKDNQWTYDENYPICNATRGYRTSCSYKCSHTVNSCHYGGRTGTTGAQAVDFNAKNGVTVFYDVVSREVVTEQFYNEKRDAAKKGDNPAAIEAFSRLSFLNGDAGLEQAIKWVAKNDETCGSFAKRIALEGNHIHVSTSACDADGKTKL
jgi:hypothetical protein